MKNYLKQFLFICLLTATAACNKTATTNNYGDLFADVRAIRMTLFSCNTQAEFNYLQLEKYKLRDEKIAGPEYAKAFTLHKHVLDLHLYIQQVQSELIANAESMNKMNADTLGYQLLQHPDEVSSTSRMMVGSGNEPGGYSVDLEIKLREIGKLMDTLSLEWEGRNNSFMAQFERPGQTEKWQMTYFKDKPLIRTLLVLESDTHVPGLTGSDVNRRMQPQSGRKNCSRFPAIKKATPFRNGFLISKKRIA